jgi:hypothetical protein
MVLAVFNEDLGYMQASYNGAALGLIARRQCSSKYEAVAGGMGSGGFDGEATLLGLALEQEAFKVVEWLVQEVHDHQADWFFTRALVPRWQICQLRGRPHLTLRPLQLAVAKVCDALWLGPAMQVCTLCSPEALTYQNTWHNH